jgi:two-component system, sensor histidine kinase and response regulator
MSRCDTTAPVPPTRLPAARSGRYRRPSRPLRVLLAEDNLVNQKLVVRITEKQGHVVTVASDGKKALALLRDHEFDVVLMDIQMPVMGGFESTSIIREEEKTTGRHVPIIALTAHAMKGDRERCLEAGMDDYLSKPVNAQELLEAIERIVSHDGDLLLTPS